MTSPASLLSATMNAQPGLASSTALKRLQAAAAMDGQVDALERGLFSSLKADGKIDQTLAPALDAWLKQPTNPEVGLVRAKVPGFDARVAAIAKHAKAGDLIFWQDGTGGMLSKLLGEYDHVSLALGNGKLLDTMTIEGASISTTESVVAKTARRLKARTIAIGRPKTPLTATQLKTLRAFAESVQGREYALLSKLADPKAPLSCSRTVYEALLAAGHDLAPIAARQTREAVMPGDLMKAVRPVGLIDEAGVFKAVTHDAFVVAKPRTWVRALSAAFDFVMKLAPGMWSFAMKVQAKMVQNMRKI